MDDRLQTEFLTLHWPHARAKKTKTLLSQLLQQIVDTRSIRGILAGVVVKNLPFALAGVVAAIDDGVAAQLINIVVEIPLGQPPPRPRRARVITDGGEAPNAKIRTSGQAE